MPGLWLIWVELVVYGGVIAVAGTLLTRHADVIADKTGWSGAWIGLVLLATVISLPELAIDMAIANLIGSNLVNVLIPAIDDLFYLPGPIFGAVSPVHAVSAASAMLMSGVVIIALLMRPRVAPGLLDRRGARSHVCG